MRRSLFLLLALITFVCVYPISSSHSQAGAEVTDPVTDEDVDLIDPDLLQKIIDDLDAEGQEPGDNITTVACKLACSGGDLKYAKSVCDTLCAIMGFRTCNQIFASCTQMGKLPDNGNLTKMCFALYNVVCSGK